MATIEKHQELLTLVNVFTVSEDKQAALAGLLVHATNETMRQLPGFVSASIHRSLDGTRVINYAQWRSQADFDAMKSSPQAQRHMQAAAALASLEPIVCQVVDSISAGAAANDAALPPTDNVGAIPPTGGVPPEDAAPANGSASHERVAADDLADGIDLLLRGARKGLRAVDPRIEATAERALLRLQALDAAAVTSFQKASGLETAQLEQLTMDVGRDLAAVVERVAARVEAAFPGNKVSRS